MSFARVVDDRLQNSLGIPYLRLTRDCAIHDRSTYLAYVIRKLPGGPLRILDVGCGSGIALRYLASLVPQRMSSYMGIDRDTAKLRRRYRQIPLMHTFYDVDLDDDWKFGEFDLVWCSEVLEHLIDDKGLFRKICRSVRHGGCIGVSTPSRAHLERVGKTFPAALKISARQDGGHVRIGYTPDELKALCVGTSARFVRADVITRSNESFIRRASRRGVWCRLNNLWNLSTRRRTESFAISGETEFSYADYLSVTALYQVT